MTKLERKWEARLAREGMPAKPVGHAGMCRLDAGPADNGNPTRDYWTAITHVVHALNGEWSTLDMSILKAYAETGYLSKAARETKVTERRARTALARLYRWIKDKKEPRQGEKER